MTDPVLLITGASSGIGEETARHAVRAGYRVVIAARRQERLDALARELGGPDKTLALGCDVTDEASQKTLVKRSLEHFGRLDAVFANAGRGGSPGGFAEADPASWKDLVLTNIYGVALTIQATLPALKESEGHIILTGSAAGRATIPGSMYSASKWAVTGIGYNLREELRGTGIRVTLLEPGVVDTPFFDQTPEQYMLPEDIAAAVLYALSQPKRVDVNEILIRPTPLKA
ncbi:NADP-dependent 3-hydroxy acid dehydrogenase YdfG [Natronospira proteinivora]|uniref:NADP-dependent 3-hydroxy acid dehydrogenase YdfG n=1 Tax=Natronospira proteinivora TaxID=1807133 RepID=A0ABT1GAK7_9GAMM|nr:SDR family oxidoreductase [Natronospira proteinivora]MCP1728361.1 NADP-dependent 3-hydroxy acid dehydrogenase YdfG [Natronospira proteinivora]